jgi:uncharacterized protein YqeY
MGLQQAVRDDLKVAMKARNSAKTDAIRILIGEFGRQMEKELSDDQVIAIIKKLIKSEKELLAAKGEESSSFLEEMQAYLPQQATEDEVRAWITANINFGDFANKMQAMKPIMTYFGSRVEGNMVKSVLQSLI